MESTNVAPHSLDAERAVLGAVLLTSEYLNSIRLDERLVPEDFYREQHGFVFEAMCVLQDQDRPIDTLTVAGMLRELGRALEDSAALLDDLAGWAPAAGHAREYARIVRTHSMRRRLLTAAYEVQAGVYREDRSVRDLIDQAEQAMMSITDARSSELVILDPSEEMDRLAGVREGVEVVGLSSGFKDFDRLTSGFQPGNLVVLAARPSMGKSALVVNFAEHVAAAGKPVALFSLEMSRGEILRRLLASRARLSGDTLLRGPIPPDRWEKVERAVVEVSQWPLYVDEGMDAGVIDIRAKARRLHRRVPLGLVIVDYVQLMRADVGAENRNIEVGKITRGLKLLAKELAVPVIAVSQLSRAVEHRQDKRPQLSDLRDSGSVEQDADLVAFLFRESYYDPECDEPDVTELNIAKHRNGPLGRVKLTFQARYPSFANYISAERLSGVVPAVSSDDGEAMPF